MLLISLLSLITLVLATGNVCKNGNVINKRLNGLPFYWPPTWNESQAAPFLEQGQLCSWTVTIPQGYYAKLIISGETLDLDSYFQTIDSAGNLARTTHEGLEPYYFVSPKFQLVVSNDSPATFAFKIIWLPLPPAVDLHYGIGFAGFVINATNTPYAHEYGASGITLLTFPENTTDLFSLRSVLVYEGNDLKTANYISNLFLLYQTGKQWVSRTNGIVVVNLEASTSMDQLLIQGSQYLTAIGEMVELRPELNSIYTGALQGGEKKSSLVSVADVKMRMVDVKMNLDATVAIYYGSPDVQTHDKTYTGEQLKQALPLEFPGDFTQFVVSNGKAVFTFES
ncbi:CUB-like domain-containing protein [Caenorhabditis elegans]|uniref:CUB-like domain-containing protein n=1 Tax=Caenorhabditis elegans TaxID=6239 RepID=Q9XUH2_CAEEL|nr:CUB-like domain-containing protein [Caenorhabditis elegans]CAB05139.2 CUB-like domain-containing protein [Caenorhabditis elegans]|eukprot:NP_502475.2 DAF-16/FOXO Controlled, germline Tumor affecting [Caenorhabditis elegans]